MISKLVGVAGSLKIPTGVACDASGKFIATTSTRGIDVYTSASLFNSNSILKPLNIITLSTSAPSHSPVSCEWNPHLNLTNSLLATAVPSSGSSSPITIWSISNSNTFVPLVRLSTSANTTSSSSSSSSKMSVAWSRFDPNILLTSSSGQGSIVQMWDIREPQQAKQFPTKSFNASLVAWNKCNRYLFATGHETGEINLWDIRSERSLNFLTAHRSKITCIDWSSLDQSFLLSSGQEKNIKIWNSNEPKDFVAMIPLSFPVTCARFTPVGFGIILSTQNDNNIGLWHLRDLAKPIHIFKNGHSGGGGVLSFDFRPIQLENSNLSSSEYQIISCGKDRKLISWTIPQAANEELFKIIDLSRLQSSKIATTTTSSTTTMETSSSSLNQGDLLEREFDSIMQHKPNSITIANIDRVNRTCIVTCSGSSRSGQSSTIPSLSVQVKFSFPSMYPRGAAPSFDILQSFSKNTQQNLRILKSLMKTSQVLVEKNKPCLDELLSELDVVVSAEIANAQTELLVPGLSPIPETADPSVSQPCPRLAGCCFDPNGRIIYFAQKRILLRNQGDSPRTYAQLLVQLRQPQMLTSQSKFSSPAPLTTITVNTNVSPNASNGAGNTTNNLTASTIQSSSSYYTVAASLYSRTELAASPMSTALPDFYRVVRPAPKRHSEEIQRQRSFATCLFLSNVSGFLPFNKNIAKNYTLEGSNLKLICKQNEKVASEASRRDLATLWQVLSVIVDQSGKDSGKWSEKGKAQRGIPWSEVSFGRPFILNIFHHYEKLRDIQTLGMISCILSRYDDSNTPQEEDILCQPLSSSSNRVSLKLRRTSSVSVVGGGNNGGNNSASSPTMSPIVEPPIPPSTPPLIHLSSGKIQIQAQQTPEKQQQLQQHSVNKQQQQQANSFHPSPLFLSTIPSTSSSSSLPSSSRGQKDANEPIQTLLDPIYEHKLVNNYIISYASLLQSWGLFTEMSSVLQFSKILPREFCSKETCCELCGREKGGIEEKVCPKCKSVTSKTWCPNCHMFLVKCSICELSVRGISWFCPICLHGGHLDHLMDWFQNHEECPTGCGCRCKKNPHHQHQQQQQQQHSENFQNNTQMQPSITITSGIPSSKPIPI